MSTLVGKKMECGYCGHESTVKPSTPVLNRNHGSGGKLVAITYKCEKCGEGVAVWVD